MRAKVADTLKEKGYVSATVAAELLKVSKATVHRMVRDGMLIGTHVGGGKLARLYVYERSIAEHVGPVASRLLGLV